MIQQIPGGRGRSEGSLNEREEEAREEEEGKEEALESIESDTACSLWEQKTNKVREKRSLIRINTLFLVGSTM